MCDGVERREGKQAGLLAFALLDVDQHTGAVDVLGPERDGRRDPEARGIRGEQRQAIDDLGDRFDETNDFLLTEDDGERPWLAAVGNLLDRPRSVAPRARYAVELIAHEEPTPPSEHALAASRWEGAAVALVASLR